MEAVILVGIQGAGKSSFCRDHFFASHIRINLDMLRTRHRERRFIETCLATGQRFVVDNTNPTAEDRARYVVAARAARFRTVCFFFPPDLAGSLTRNANRLGRTQVPAKAILRTIKCLEPPSTSEDFDAVFTVHLAPDHGFLVTEQL